MKEPNPSSKKISRYWYANLFPYENERLDYYLIKNDFLKLFIFFSRKKINQVIYWYQN